MDKSSVTWTDGSDWWLSRTTMGGKERYPKQIRVGDLDRPRVYYPINRDALLALAEDVDEAAAMAVVMDASKGAKLLADLLLDIARRIREACGEVES